MKTALARFLLSAVPLLAFSDTVVRDWQAQVWQADIQIRTLEVTRSKSVMTVRVVVFTEKDDEARDAHLIVLLPPGVGIDRLSNGCTATTAPSMLPSLRAAIECNLGSIPDRALREVVVTTTLPPESMSKRFGVFTYSATPDPLPGNNYAERTIQ